MMKEVSSKKIDVLISFAYAMVISLGLACFIELLIMGWDQHIYTYPYAEPAFKALAIAALVMFIAVIVLDCIRGRRMRFAILLRIGVLIAATLPALITWILFFERIVRPIANVILP